MTRPRCILTLQQPYGARMSNPDGRTPIIFVASSRVGASEAARDWASRVARLVIDAATTEGFSVRSILDSVEIGSSWSGALLRSMRDADVIVADLSDRNPNVMYELGMATSLGKPVLALVRDVAAVPVDLRDRQAVALRDDIHDNRSAIIAALRALTAASGPAFGLVDDPYATKPRLSLHAEQPPIQVNIYNGMVLQGPVTMADHSSIVGQNFDIQINLAAGDTAGLLDHLAAAGLPVEDLEALAEAIRLDTANEEASNEPGPNVQRWWTRLTLGSRSVAGKVAIGASGGVVAKLIEAYYGIH